MDEFRDYSYPNFDEVTKQIPLEDKKNEADITNALSRLKEIKNALSSYENNFDIQDMEINNLSELRQFVAYPTNEERINVNCPRKYLTVKDVLIECPFPNVNVSELGLIDLPGLGETDPNIEKRHVEGFKNEVDFVLVLKNSSKDAFWTNEDIQCLGLLEQAKGHFGKSGDFVAIGINTCKTDNNIDALVEDIRRKVNEGVDNKHNKVFIFDAKDLQSVHTDMLNPVLDYIAKILPNLDKELIEERFNNINQLEQRIKRKILNLENDITRCSSF